MAETTIEWTRGPNGEKGFSFNPWVGCTKVGPGCDHCYAEGWAKRSGQVEWGPGAGRRRTSEANWRKPLAWNAEAERLGIRYRVFCASLADVFDNEVPAEWRADLFHLIEQTPNLDWLLVTKRIGNAAKMIFDARLSLVGSSRLLIPGVLPNVWIGATITNQAEADRDIPKLLDTPAAVRFLSMEPLLGPVNLTRINPQIFDASVDVLRGIWRWKDGPNRKEGSQIDWVIVGGESGPKARPMHPQWARDIRDQCEAAGVPFLFKQWGEWAPNEHFTHLPRRDEAIHEWFDGYVVIDHSWRYGKKKAGRLLDGREHNGYPGGAR